MDRTAQLGERQASPPLLVTKLQPPPARDHTVERARLHGRLRASPAARLVVLAAPPGYGKSTMLAASRDSDELSGPVAWLTLDREDNDPVVLWSYLLEAFRRACPALEVGSSPNSLGRREIDKKFVAELVNALSTVGEITLVLDDFHLLSGAHGGRDSFGRFLQHAPANLRTVVAGRTDPALRLSALRAHGELVELRAEDLAFTTAEADVLLNDRLELGLARDDVEELVERTEGWPAGLYLAALSLRGVDDRRAFVSRFGAANRHVVDFLVDEVLEAHDPALQTLMLRSSVLTRLSGPLCDSLLEREGSADQLTELASTNLFLIPLDDRGQWFRFHHLFGQLLRAELEHREPGLAPILHERACAWHRDHGSIDEAIEHALDAGSCDAAGDLIAARWAEYANLGRHVTLLAWLERLPREMLDASAVLLTVKAWVLSMSEMRDEALAAMAAAEQLDGLDHGPLPDGASSVAASLAVLGATLPGDDVGSAYEKAVRAAELEQPESPYWPMVCRSRGKAHFFRGEPIEAEYWLVEASRVGPSVGMSSVTGSALAYLSLIAGDEGKTAQQGLLAEEATQLAAERAGEKSDGEVSLAMAAYYAASGAVKEACPLVERSVVALRASGQPIDLAYALIWHVRVLREVGDYERAAAAIAEARVTVDACPDAGILDDWLAALERTPRARSRKVHDELSERELVVLRALTGPLSERDIGRELYLSRNTVHSHAQSIYRKLGVSSRSDAIRRGRELGLI